MTERVVGVNEQVANYTVIAQFTEQLRRYFRLS
jgi:hypothetical protein